MRNSICQPREHSIREDVFRVLQKVHTQQAKMTKVQISITLWVRRTKDLRLAQPHSKHHTCCSSKTCARVATCSAKDEELAQKHFLSILRFPMETKTSQVKPLHQTHKICVFCTPHLSGQKKIYGRKNKAKMRYGDDMVIKVALPPHCKSRVMTGAQYSATRAEIRLIQSPTAEQHKQVKLTAHAIAAPRLFHTGCGLRLIAETWQRSTH